MLNRLFKLTATLLLLCFALPALAQWKYYEGKVGVDEVPYKLATVISTESLDLDFPYKGRNLPGLTVRTNPKGWDVAFSIQKGQLSCYQTCQVKIKIDDKPSRAISMVRAADSGVSNVIFVSNSSQAQALAREIADAKLLAIELPIYKAMGTVVKFNVMGLNLAELGGMNANSPSSNSPAADKLIQDIQHTLNQKGFNAGPADGFMGQQTQAAIIAAQRSLGVTADGRPSQALLANLRSLHTGTQASPSDRNQAGGGRNDGYGAKVRACVQPGVSFPAPARGTANPTAQYRVNLRPDGTIAGIKLTRSSGNPNFDRAVETGIRRCSPFPTPPSGKYPGYIDVNHNMFD